MLEYVLQELELMTWTMIINGCGICYMLNVVDIWISLSGMFTYLRYKTLQKVN